MIKKLVVMSVVSATALNLVPRFASGQILDPITNPNAAEAMRQYSDYPGIPSDPSEIQAYLRQVQIEAIRAQIEAREAEQERLQEIKSQVCTPNDDDQPTMTETIRRMQAGNPLPQPLSQPPDQDTIQQDNTPEYERQIWRQNQQVFDPSNGASSDDGEYFHH